MTSFTKFRLLQESLSHAWRSHLAVALGTAIATAVLTGALVVGDSVTASLRLMTLDRLGAIDFAVTGPRFVREALADETAEEAARSKENVRNAPAIVLPAAIEHASGQTRRRAANVQLVGCDERLWNLIDHGRLAPPPSGSLVVSRRLADALRVQPGDEVSVLVEIPQTIPRDALLGDREQTVTELLLNVSGIAETATGAARFGLNPSQQLPQNAFVNLAQMQEQLGVNASPATSTHPAARPARVNSMFFSRNAAPRDGGDALAAQTLTADLHRRLRLADLHLRIVDHSDRGYISLESEQMILDPRIVKLAQRVGEQLGHPATPAFVYLLNVVTKAGHPEQRSMYAVAAGIPPAALESPPTGSPPAAEALAALIPQPRPDADAPIGVVINDWLASDLNAAVGDVLEVKYHQVGDRGELPEIERRLQVQAIVPLTPPWDDQGLVPYVPGITDANSFREWRQPFPMKMDDITPRDEDYWKQHRATPKVLMPLEEARSLWRSRYGETTSVRIAGVVAADFEQRFLEELSPPTTGLLIQPIKEQGLQAAAGTTDFAGLFLGFSLFLIVAAALLIAILFRLGVELRIRELGLLIAVGWTDRSVRRLALCEALIVVVTGTLLGLPLAVGYAGLMIYGLKTWWNAAVGTQFLVLSVVPLRLAAGGFASLVMAACSVALALRSTRKLTARAMLAGTVDAAPALGADRSRLRAWLVPAICGALAVLLAAASLAGLVPSAEAFEGLSWTAVTFFLSGALALVAGMTSLSSILRRPAGASSAWLNLATLALRNAARNPRRSALTTGLVAAATFLVASVGSGRRNPAAELPARDSGSGGFLLVAESSTPILYDLNTDSGRAQLGLAPDVSANWPPINVVPLRMNPGENASCLNLYQTQLPTILALPDQSIRDFARDGRFKFIGASPRQAWMKLLDESPPGTVPVLGDVNTLQYSLHKAAGDHIPLDEAPTRRGLELQIEGMFDGSVFQGVLVMAESQFLRLYPERTGFRYFLIDAPQPKSIDEARSTASSLTDLLETRLRDYGFDAERVSVRLSDFLAVQNTYLSTFQTLGGLGLLLGVCGLFAVMLRNVFERRGELALLRAVGLPNSRTRLVVLGENLLLVGWGLAVGIGSALLAMAPHLASQGALPPWRALAVLMASVLAAGALAATIAIGGALRAPLVAALRDE